ncbi:MAG: phage head-tail connector protein [Ottowia sp.]|nr:phage head-tail connector protein [Ottowia sp.]
MSLQQITIASEEPVPLAEAKLHLRIDSNEDDALIATLIGAARQSAEMLTGQQFVTARWQYGIDHFPAMDQPIHLPKNPVQSVITIKYLDLSGSLQSLDIEDYLVDKSSQPARVAPSFGKNWPSTLAQLGAVSVTFDAGYGLAVDVPAGIKAWIKLRVGSLYACREELSTSIRTDTDTLLFFNGLLDPYRVVTL